MFPIKERAFNRTELQRIRLSGVDAGKPTEIGTPIRAVSPAAQESAG
jgi:hypothetical protein